MRTRTAAKHALSFPFVPVRQVMFCHLASARENPVRRIICQSSARVDQDWSDQPPLPK